MSNRAMNRDAKSASDLHPAVVSAEVASRLAFENPQLRQSITLLETTLSLFVEQFGAPKTEFKISGEDLNDDREIALHKLGIARHLLGTRLGAHLTSVVESLSDQRTLSVAESVRSALETAGAATYYEAAFRKCARNVPALLTQANRAIYGARFAWAPWQNAIGQKSREELETFVGGQARRDREPRVDGNSPPSVMTFIDALETSFLRKLEKPAERDGKPTPMRGQVRTIYSQLCDFVHPSVGSWYTFGDTEPELLKVVVSSRSRLESLQFLWFGIGECVATMSLLGFHALQDIETLRTSLV